MSENLRHVKAVLAAIAEGYPVHGYEDRFVVVENPRFKEDDGSSPNLVLDLWAFPEPVSVTETVTKPKPRLPDYQGVMRKLYEMPDS